MKDEFDWIKSITPQHSFQKELVAGIGDDAALWSVNEHMDQVVCVDTMVEGVHFTRDTLSSYQVGFKALAVNISDVAAMGGIPQFYLVSIAISPDWNEEELKEIYEGMNELAKTHKMDLIGGDTVSTKGPLVLTVTVIGKVEKGRKLLRSYAKPDDIVFLTGTTGESAAGLDLLLLKTRHAVFTDNEKKWIHQHQMPIPHIEQGRILANSGYRISLNDVSDGIASELNEIAESSNVTIHIQRDKLPVSSSFAELQENGRLTHQLYGGEDYVLVGTASIEDFVKLTEAFQQHSLSLYEIGKVGEAGKTAVYLHKKNEEPELLAKKGFNHFRER
ncbi:thiamine monophosphate kinase [Fictibacillus phosphorivorans]|uniref:Thiamine-monophosphate kinase n=1 Tax=Fictibacillus phosphorivorans TaxID=1221500 RepID=A0A163QTL4_9BACL|nr:thiamine-phosphate kinase [Fictibacillus phosphorivorans]KZE65657.1 thiamine monophosphate kinase [Fictibacillus phosphorivorans]